MKIEVVDLVLNTVYSYTSIRAASWALDQRSTVIANYLKRKQKR